MPVLPVLPVSAAVARRRFCMVSAVVPQPGAAACTCQLRKGALLVPRR